MKRSITLNEDARKKALASIRRYLEENLDEDAGDLKATLFLDYVLAELGPAIYNSAIADARSYFAERVADLEAVCHYGEFPYWPKKTK
jgi:uncharacterized protein (DUF2164 family)